MYFSSDFSISDNIIRYLSDVGFSYALNLRRCKLLGFSYQRTGETKNTTKKQQQQQQQLTTNTTTTTIGQQSTLYNWSVHVDRTHNKMCLVCTL
jgi:hypothetical protein